MTSNDIHEDNLKKAQDLVRETDTGARRPSHPWVRNLLLVTAFTWSLFQLWVASPLQFSLGVFILNNTESRSVHLAFAVFLAFMAYPFGKKSPRHHVPVLDWVFALAAAFCAGYLYLFYNELAERPGYPTTMDVGVSVIGMLLLLEATRRALGPPLVIVAVVFLFYTFAGNWDIMPDMIAHKGQSLNKIASHMWLSTEGVFGIALGVSANFVFLFVLFGALLDKAGAGNFFIKLAFSMLGHLRGGPAKAAVLSSAMTGVISGSSIANVVTTGTFTIPLMRKVGFSREKGGAVEVASSVNGQIMPPVMGAAAFLMVEYIGIPYIEVIKHAFLPALISYIALLYMVHLEALKADMKVLDTGERPALKYRLIGWGIFISSMALVISLVYYALLGIKAIMGDATVWGVAAMVGFGYLLLLFYKSRFEDLDTTEFEDGMQLPTTAQILRTGLHYLLPIAVLVWCLMVERLSPGLSAFWSVVLMIVILATQRPIIAFFRKQQAHIKSAFKLGMLELYTGMVTGARNMIGIGVATATAGIIVGTVSLTGVGQVMTDLIEVLSGGNFVLVLMLTAFICLILGMGLPTTANYIVVASLMTPVIVELGSQNGILVPLIAVHLFVFYFGIMADVTPPVGLASFAAAAVSGGDPIKTGVQAFLYSSRTVVLPFLFIYNNELLLIGVDNIWHGLMVFAVSTVAILLFSASVQGYFLTRSKWYESLVLLLVAFSLFNPQFWINQFYPPYRMMEPAMLTDAAEHTPPSGTLRLQMVGENEFGDPVEFFVMLPLEAGANGEERLEKAGLMTREEDGRVWVDDLGFNSVAESAGLDFDQQIIGVEVEQVQPSKRLVYIPALVLLIMVVAMQRTRRRGHHLIAKEKGAIHV